MLGVLGDLEGVARLIGGQVGDQDERLAVALDLVVHVNAVRLHDGHADPSRAPVAGAPPA